MTDMLLFSVPKRLMSAVLDIWEGQGHAAMSARAVAHSAGVQLSAIYHHFGDMERLLLAAQNAARVEAEAWCAHQREALAALPPMPPAALASVMAALIDDWAEGQRRLAFTWRHGLLLAARDPAYRPAADAWDTLWQDFWEDVCGLCSLPGRGAVTSLLFDSKGLLHLLRWRRPVDRAGLEEFCRGWAQWLCGGLAEEGPWRRLAREEARHTMPTIPARTEATAAVAAAAARVMAEGGVTTLTHRAVAARAGVTLGVVSHKFRTSAELVRAGFEAIYSQLVSGGQNREQLPAAAPSHEVIAILARSRVDLTQFLVMEELMLAVAQDPQWRAYAPQLRYSRGRSSGAALQALLGPNRAVSPLDAALFSGVMAGLHRRATRRPPAEAETLIADRLTEIASWLG